MGDWGKHFTLYDLIGYFAVGLISCLGFDLVWHAPDLVGRLGKAWETAGKLNVYQAALAGVGAYMVGQVLGSASSFVYVRLIDGALGWLIGDSYSPPHRYPHGAQPKCGWAALRRDILDDREGFGDDAGSVFWLCVAYARERAPATYGDAFKWLVYSGAARTLSLVSVSWFVIGRAKGMGWWAGAFLLLAAVLYYTFFRMLRQYHVEVINSVFLLLSERIPGDNPKAATA